MKSFALILSALLAGCVAQPPVKTPQATKYLYKACRPEAFILDNSLKEAGFKSHVVRFEAWRMGQPLYGHCICVYMAPKGMNNMNGWDSRNGSSRIRNAFYEDAWNEAGNWLLKNNTGRGEYLYQAYLDDGR